MAAGPVGSIALFGLNAVAAALSSERIEPLELLLREGIVSRRLEELSSRARALGVPVRVVAREHLDRLAGGEAHQGAAVTIREWPVIGEGELSRHLSKSGPPPFLLVLDHLHDVGNLGAVLRSAYFLGVTGVIVPKARAAPLNAGAVRASAGTAVLVDIYRVANLPRVIGKLKDEGLWVYGLEAGEGKSILEAELTGPLALILGGEHQGLSRLVKEKCDMLVHVPMYGREGSLNASVAAGIAIFEVMRRRKKSL